MKKKVKLIDITEALTAGTPHVYLLIKKLENGEKIKVKKEEEKAGA